MLTGKRLERYMTLFSSRSAAQLDHLGRALRGVGLMPTGGRGISAPTLTATDAANFLIALCLDGTPMEAVHKVGAYRTAAASWSGVLRDDADMDNPPIDAFAGCKTFGEALEAILGGLANEAPISTVEVVREWPRAEILMKDGRRYFYGVAGVEEGREAGVAVFPISTKVTLPVSVLSMICLALVERDEATGGYLLPGE